MLFRNLVRRCSHAAKMGKKHVKVTILGGDTAIGEIIAFQLKVWSAADEIKLHGSSPCVRDISADLNQIPTSCRVTPFSGPNQIKQAMAKADVVLVYNESGVQKEDISDDTLFQLNAPVLEKIAKIGVSQCPDAVFAVMSPPLNSTVPLFAHVLRENGMFKAQKLLGVVSDVTMIARKIVAKHLGLSPTSVWIPMTGGASPKTLVPVITAARPGGVFLKKEADIISKKVRSMPEEIRKVNHDEPGSIGPGYAVADLIRAICRGLQGKETDAHPALVRTRVISGIDFFVLPVHFGPYGISETHAIPDMSSKDIELMDCAMREMLNDIARFKCYVSKKRTACVACQTPQLPEYRSVCSF